MESTSIPAVLVVVFVLCSLLLIGSGLVLFVFPGTEIGKRIPSWVAPAAYAAFMLCLPVVLLVVVMALFPCWWGQC